MEAVELAMERFDNLAELVDQLGDADFVCLDTETANSSRSSLCAIGVAVVCAREVVATASELINPRCDFDPFNTGLHGIDEDSVAGARTVDDAWSDISAIGNGRVLAFHNAAFDVSVLRSSAAHLEGRGLSAEVACTLRLARRVWPSKPSYGLDFLAFDLGLELDHHDAGSDAAACAGIAVGLLASTGAPNLAELHSMVDMKPGVLSAEDFTPIWTKRSSSTLQRLEPSADAGPDAPLASTTVCFTGTLASMPRQDAAALVAASGGTFVNAMTRSVDLLVVGDDQYLRFVRGEASSKLRRAAAMREAGDGPEIVREADFLRLLGN